MTGGVAQVVKHLLALCSTSITAEKKKKKEKITKRKIEKKQTKKKVER
jgi:hypothetical protein